MAEDTSESGEVTTESVQLPAARGIEGLADLDNPRLVMRCVDGTVTVEIVTGSERDSSEGSAVPVVLDSVPPCE